MMAWNDEVIVTDKGAFSAKDEAPLWKTPFTISQHAEAIVIAKDKVVFAVVDKIVEPQKFGLVVLNLADGKKVAELALPARVTLNGIVVSNQRIFVTLHDGTLLCLGE
jgi:hypothetical protein